MQCTTFEIRFLQSVISTNSTKSSGLHPSFGQIGVDYLFSEAKSTIFHPQTSVRDLGYYTLTLFQCCQPLANTIADADLTKSRMITLFDSVGFLVPVRISIATITASSSISSLPAPALDLLPLIF